MNIRIRTFITSKAGERLISLHLLKITSVTEQVKWKAVFYSVRSYLIIININIVIYMDMGLQILLL